MKSKKCTIAAEQMSFLGFIVDQQGLRTDPAKVEAVATFPRPTNKTEVRAFLGLATYYRRFVKNFAKVASPLNDMLRKDHDRIWRRKQEDAFSNLKKILATAPVLLRPDFDKPFTVYTDASAIGLEAILTQEDQEGTEKVIAYRSRGTRGAKKKYRATQLECLAVVWATELY